MRTFAKTLAAIALCATAIGGATLAAFGLGGLQMSPHLAPTASPWQGYSNGWDVADGQCISSTASKAVLIGVVPARNDWRGMALAGCNNGWAYPLLKASKIDQADSFERRYAGVRLARLPVIP